ncbi:MAG: YbaB/EbfC family nucleoid-associated protein [Bacilli bacterium]|nr:YbaB/EbfC family nucleoid-associated protein [Bacilli bacterium]
MNMQALMKQAQNLQKDMMKAKEEIDKKEFTGESALVKVTIMGTKEVKKIEISKESDLSVDDLEMLEDMILVAINDAMKKIDDETEQKMGKFSSMLPGGF